MARDQFGLQEPGLERKEEFDFLTAGTAENPIEIQSEQQIPQRQRDPETGRFVSSEGGDSQFQIPEVGDANPMVQENKDQFGLAAEEPPAQAPQPEEPPAGGGPEPGQGTEGQQAVEDLIFGKYKSIEEAEKGYKEIVALQTRTAQARREAERRVDEAFDYQQRLEETLRQALPIVQQANQRQVQQPRQPVNPWDEPAPQQGQLSPQQIQELVSQQVQTQVGTLTQQAQQRAEAVRTREEAEASVMGFYEKHPEITVEGELDGQITETILSLNDTWERGGQDPFDISNPDSLEIAYEASKNPELRAVLEMNPRYVDSDAGMQLARFQAALIRGEQPITQQVVQGTTSPVPSTPATGQRRPVTERASVGAAAPNQDRPLDEFEQAVLEFKKNRTAGLSGSVFS